MSTCKTSSYGCSLLLYVQGTASWDLNSAFRDPKALRWNGGIIIIMGGVTHHNGGLLDKHYYYSSCPDAHPVT
jgi:hypothetical protein